MKLIYVASPYAGDIEKNTEFAKEAWRHVMNEGHAFFVPHLLYPAILEEHQPEQRQAGLDMGLAMLEHCDELWCYGDHISSGMFMEIEQAKALGIPVLRRMPWGSSPYSTSIPRLGELPGAFSSADGEDFRAVIEEIVRIKDSTCDVPRPDTGRWESSGTVFWGHEFSLAWRVLDAQYWGAAAPAQGCTDDTGAACLTPWDMQSRRITPETSTWPALYGGEGGGRGRNCSGTVYKTAQGKYRFNQHLSRGDRCALQR